MPFVLILAVLQLAVPVRCYEQPAAWEEAKAVALAPTISAAFYMPEANTGPSYIALGPKACRNVRQATTWGAFIVGHELAHRWQDEHGLPFDEAQADRIGMRNLERWQGRLRVLFRVPAPAPVVRLAAGP